MATKKKRKAAPGDVATNRQASYRYLFLDKLEAELFQRGWHAEWEGEVTGVIGAGAFVAFGDGYEGLLPVRRLRGDWWELDELETRLVGAESGRAIRLGDPVTVQVERVDAPRGRVDLSPVLLG